MAGETEQTESQRDSSVGRTEVAIAGFERVHEPRNGSRLYSLTMTPSQMEPANNLNEPVNGFSSKET